MSLCHHLRRMFGKNPLLEARLIFRNLTAEIAGTRQALEKDLSVLNTRLEGEMDLRERGKIKREIEQVQQELNGLTGEIYEPSPAVLLTNGLQNNLKAIEEKLRVEADIKKREKLQAQKLSCINALQARQKPVASPEEVSEAVKQMQSDQRILDRLEDGRINPLDLEFLLDSDILSFIDHDFEGALRAAQAQMITSDRAQNVLGRTRDTIAESSRAWLEHKKGVEGRIEALENKRSSLDDSKNGKRRRAEIESELPRLHAEIRDGRLNWEHKDRLRRENASSPANLSKIVNPATLEKLQRLITEAQQLRMEKVEEYIDGEFGNLEKRFSRLKKDGIFSRPVLRSMEEKIQWIKGFIREREASGIPTSYEDLIQLAKNFKDVNSHLSTSAKEIHEIRRNRPQVETYIKTEFERLRKALGNVSSDRLHEALEIYRKKQEAQGAADSAILNKAASSIGQLCDPDSELHRQMDEIAGRLETMSDMSPEELAAFRDDLKTLQSRLNSLENIEESLSEETDAGKKAHQTLAELETIKDITQIREMLERNLGAEHVKFVPHAEFETNYRQYTQTGHMVFTENRKTGQWNVVLDESTLTDNVKLQEIKKQLTHELLHLEFEKSKKVKNEFRKAFVEENPKWQEIRETFLEVASSTNKLAPEGGQWKDDDILSELFAMQNELGNTWSKGSKPIDKLNNLIKASGVKNSLGDIRKKTQSYADDATPDIVRGYEGGVSDEEDEAQEGPRTPEEAKARQDVAAYQKFEAEIDALDKRIQELQNSDHLNEVDGAAELLAAMKDYNQGTRRLNSDFKSDPESEVFRAAIESRNEKVGGDLNEVESQIGKVSRNAPNTEISLGRKLWLSTSFLSIEDWVQTGIDVYEFVQRRHKRKMADHAAKLGMALFSGTDLGREASARQQKAEADEVQEWKSRYENKDAWALLGEIDSMANSLAPNPDQLKAVLRILADKGRIDWRSPNLWNVLNKLQASVVLKPGDPILLHNPILLRQRLHKALGEIYDYDEFTSLEQKNQSSYDSNKKSYNSVNDSMQNELSSRLDELLHQHRSKEQVDPILYESILEYSIENGKSEPEIVFFHLIAGMAEGLLSCDRGLFLGKKLNNWPTIDWFTTLKPPFSTEDWKQFALQNFPKDFNRGSIQKGGNIPPDSQFLNWYWTVAQNDKKVVDRVRKSVTERSWDHDWGRAIACLGDAKAAKAFLSGKGGQMETKATAVGNAYVGAVQWLEENSKNSRGVDRKLFARMAGWIAMSGGILNGTAYVVSNDVNTRADENMMRDTPREATMGHHGNETVREHKQRAEQFLFLIDQGFFEILTGRDREGREGRTAEQKRAIGTEAAQYLSARYPSLAEKVAEVTDVDQIYERIDLIIMTMIDGMNEGRFRQILATIAASANA